MVFFCSINKIALESVFSIKSKKKLIIFYLFMMFIDLPNDILLNIYKRYLQNNHLYYCNLELVSKKTQNIFNILYNTFKFEKFRLPYKSIYDYRIQEIREQNRNKIISILDFFKLKSIYYVKSDRHNIKLCKIYFNRCNIYDFGLIYGEEGKLLCEIKQLLSFNGEQNMIETLHDYEYMVL